MNNIFISSVVVVSIFVGAFFILKTSVVTDIVYTTTEPTTKISSPETDSSSSPPTDLSTPNDLCPPSGINSSGLACVLPGKLITMHYTGKLEDGTIFDSSKGKQPLQFVQGAKMVIPGWEKGIVGMAVGEKKTLVIPPELAYGEKGVPNRIPPSSTLIFDIILVNVTDDPQKMSTPSIVNINNTELKNLIFKKVPLIDLRRPDEWRSTGIIKGAITITLYDAKGNPDPDFVPNLIRLGFKNKPFILICRTGNRTSIAATGLTESLGFSKVYNVEKGIVGWLSDNNPVIDYK